MAEKAPKITKIEPAIASLPIRKRVAAYARVSMETDRLMHSLSAQVSNMQGYMRTVRFPEQVFPIGRSSSG